MAAQERSPLSSEVLRLMLPCPGAKVSASLLVKILDGSGNRGFSSDQVQMITASFVSPSFGFADAVAVTQDSASALMKEQFLRCQREVRANSADLRSINETRLNPAQWQLLSKHVELDMSESELDSLLSSHPNEAQSALLRACLKPVNLATISAVRAILTSGRNSDLARRISVSDPKLWAYALKNGMTVKDLSPYVRANETEMADLFHIFENEGISVDEAADFVIANRLSFFLASRDIAVLSTSTLASSKIESILTFLKHGSLEPDAISVARLKALGVADAAILAQGTDTRHMPPPPLIAVENDGDPM